METNALDKLTQTMKPFRDLRGFYFGARALIYKMCLPKQDTDTSYGELKEIIVQAKGDGLLLDYRPIRKTRFSKIIYTANTRSPLLEPIRKPGVGGDEKLNGFFDKHNFDLALKMLEDLIMCITATMGAFNPITIKFANGLVGTVKRVEEKTATGYTLIYRCYIRDSSGKDIPSEELKFYIDGNLAAF